MFYKGGFHISNFENEGKEKKKSDEIVSGRSQVSDDLKKKPFNLL